MKSKKEWPVVKEDTYSSGMNPPARPKSNNSEAPYKSVYDSKYDAAAKYSVGKKAGVGSTMQVKQASVTIASTIPSFAQAMKKDKHSA